MAPTREELADFLAGRLPSERHAAADAYLATLPPAEADALLAGVEVPATAAVGATPATVAGFQAEYAAGRWECGRPLGAGGMATVVEARDRALDRAVALKVLHARRPDETLESYVLRESAFRREAALTADLEHPAIVPVHDVGRCDGRPAFTMRAVSGRTLDQVVAAGDLPLPELIQALIRVCEAVAYAHSRGVVHRDLSPANVLIGDYGAVHVLDWGLAERVGAGTGIRAGTPGYMAPEQAGDAPADPRMDVFAVGGLLDLILRGAARPRPLRAVVRRCRSNDPEQRYRDAGAVADDLRRWVDDGITLAQDARPWEVAWLRLRRSPRAIAVAGTLCLATMVVAGLSWWQQATTMAAVRARLDDLARSVPLDQPEALAVALDEVRTIRATRPDLPEGAAVQARLETARSVAAAAALRAQVRARLDELLARTRRIGPWADQIDAWRAAIAAADPLADLANSSAIAQARAFLWRAERERGDPAATATAARLAGSGPTPGWRALGRLLDMAEFRAHEPVFCVCDDSKAVMAEPGPAATALALFAPESRLEHYARERIAIAPGDFWSLVAVARGALAAHDALAAERLALVASGAEPGSLIPMLVLGYVAIERGDWDALSEHAGRAGLVDPSNIEVECLRIIAKARHGDGPGAQADVERLPASHLRWHLAHRVGHPMELAVDGLIAAGLVIPPAPPVIGPLVPHQH